MDLHRTVLQFATAKFAQPLDLKGSCRGKGWWKCGDNCGVKRVLDCAEKKANCRGEGRETALSLELNWKKQC